MLVFLVDIIVYSKSLRDLVDRLDKVFSILSKHGLELKMRKCKFFHSSVKYLGDIVSKDSISTDDEKIACIFNWKVPQTVKELKSFLGFAGYFSRYIENFSQIAEPLLVLSKNNLKPPETKFGDNWTTKCRNSFQKLKTVLSTAPLLGFADFSLPYIVETDASASGLGAVRCYPRNRMDEHL